MTNLWLIPPIGALKPGVEFFFFSVRISAANIHSLFLKVLLQRSSGEVVGEGEVQLRAKMTRVKVNAEFLKRTMTFQ